MLTASELRGFTSMAMGSLSIGASAGIRADFEPEKVTTWSLPGTMAPPGPAESATCTSPISSGLEPYSLDKRRRISEPPPLTRTTWRRVWLSKVGLTVAKPAATRVGGRGEAPHMPVHSLCAGWALAEPANARVIIPSANARFSPRAIRPTLLSLRPDERLGQDFRSSLRGVYSPR